MATAALSYAENVIPLSGLTESECEAIHAEAFLLFNQGRATGVSQEICGKYLCVFDRHGEPYAIGREQGMCYLFDPERNLIASSKRFGVVIEALKSIL